MPLSGAFILSAALVENPIAAAVLMALAAACADMCLSPSWALCHDVGKEAAGAVTGAMNTFGAIGGAISPLVMGYSVQLWGSWTMPLVVTADRLCDRRRPDAAGESAPAPGVDGWRRRGVPRQRLNDRTRRGATPARPPAVGSQTMSARSEAPTAANEAAEAAVQAQLERMLASATFRQVDRLKRFLRFIVIETDRRPRRSAQGVRHRRAGLRQGVVLRSARGSYRPRPGAAAARAAGPLLPRGGSGRRDVIELPKGGYSPVFKRREAAERREAIDQRGLRESQHRRRHAVRRS